MRVKKDINLMRVARSRNNVNEKKTKNQTKKLPPKSSTSSSSNPVASPPATPNTTKSQTAASGDCATSQQNQTSDNNTGTNAAAAEAPIESTVKMKKDSKECQAAVIMSSSSSSPKKLANSKSKSNATTNKSNNPGKTTNDQKWKKKGGKNRINSSCVQNSQSGGGSGECNAGEINTDEKVESKEVSNIDVENNKKNQSTSVTSTIGASIVSPPVTSVPGSSSSNSSISNNNKNHKESQQTSGSNGDKKSITSTKKQTNKVCKELRNLGVNSLIKKDIDDKICRDVVDVKTSICEMVKTKSRINVQSTYNRKSSASEEPKDVDKSKKCTKTKSEIPKTKKFVKKNKKVTQVEQETSLEDIPVTKPAEETTGDHKEEENLESILEKVEEPEEKVAKPPEEKIEVESKYKKKKKKEKEIVQREPEKEKSDEDDENEREEENELDKSIQESTKMCIQKLDELLESTTNEPAEVVEIEAPPPVVEEKLEDLEKLKQIEEIIIKNEQDSKVERIFPLSESTIEQTDELEKTTVTVEKEKKKPEGNVQKRKYVKKAFLAKKKKEPAQPAPTPILVVPPPKETPEIKDIYDFNESGNNSDSMDLSNIATKSSSSTSNQPPIYKRKLNSISKSSSFDNKSINNLQLTTPELSNESNKSTVVSSSVKNEIDNGKEKVKSDEETQEKEKIVKGISESDNNNSDESDEETLKSKINKSLKLAKAGQKKQPVKPPKPKKLTKENVKKIENLTKKKSKYVKTSSSDCSDENGDESDASSTLSLRRAKEQLKSAPTAKARKMKLYGFWSGPKRHRIASLNALAKVQCLYENESRSAQELGFVRPTPAFIPPNKTLKPPTPNTPSVQSDDEDYKKEDEKPEKKPPKPKKTKAAPVVKEDKKSNEEESNAEAEEDEPEDDAESIIITNRILRTGPGLRGAGNLWEVGSMSSISDVDAVYDSDKSYKGEVRQKKKKKKPATTKGEKKGKIPPKPKEKPKNPPPKKKVAVKKSKPIKINIEDDDDDNDEKSDDDSRSSLNLATNKRKRRESETKPNEFKDLVVHKRMASLNASAILTATYEVERQLDKLENAADKNIILSDDDSINEIIIPASPKKVKEVKSENEDEDNKEQVRPVSTSVVILQDTDVTITGVYVNSSLGSNQEAYCKMQYRVQSSVTEERVLRPTGDPPKSYTPLSALSNMRPPGAQQAAQQESCTPNSAPSSRCESPPRHQPYHPSAHPSIGSHPSMSAFCTPTQLQHHDTGEQLKASLKQKGAKTTGTKAVLEERLQNWNSNKLDRRLYSVPVISKQSVEQFPTDSNIWVPLLNQPKAGLCGLSINKIDVWFFTKYATASKIRGRNLGLNGFCDNIQCLKTEVDCCVKFLCYAAMKINKKYKCKVRFNSDIIVQASCECPAGKGWSAACKHISAGLHAIEHYCQTGKSLERKSPTSELQRWHQPSIRHRSSVFKLDELTVNQNVTIPLTSENTHQFLNTEISNRNMSHFSTCRNVNPVAYFNDHDYGQNIALILLNEVNRRSLDDILIIEKATRKQSECKMWWTEKRSRISASNAADVCSTVRSKKLSIKIAHRIILQKKFTNPAVEHGKKFEKVALKHYMRIKNVNIKECGLFIDHELNYIAASPDGIYDDGSKILEIKCPTSNLPINMPYLVFDKSLGRKTLSSSHKYYLQCQLQMHVSKIYKCDFIVWSSQHIFIEEILYKKDWVDVQLSQIKQYYENIFCFEYFKLKWAGHF